MILSIFIMIAGIRFSFDAGYRVDKLYKNSYNTADPIGPLGDAVCLMGSVLMMAISLCLEIQILIK